MYDTEIARLRAEVDRLREENELLRRRERGGATVASELTEAAEVPRNWDGIDHGLTREKVARYSRQIVLGSFGVRGQSKLDKGSVLIVGAGALGSPAALYLAAAGVGRIGIVDRDGLELSNLHRQVLHREASVGEHKATSAARSIRELNSDVTVEPHLDGLTPANAVELIARYDVVLDASDNPSTRYLISDAATVAGVAVVSGAALGTDGQASVYNAGPDCPCYRCLWPTPPAAANCQRCADAGVMGYVTGVIGSLQAGETIKLLSGVGETLAGRLTIFDGLTATFRTVRLRGRSPTCVACGPDRVLRTSADVAAFDYRAFVGDAPSDAPAPPLSLVAEGRRVRPVEAAAMLAGDSAPLMLDVRPRGEFEIARVPGAVSIPLADLQRDPAATVKALGGCDRQLLVICRRGNASQRALLALEEAGFPGALDVEGGIEAWARDVDGTYPVY